MKKNILALPKDFNEYFDNLSVENKISIVKYIHENFEYDAVKKEEYLTSSVFKLAKTRLLWLAILMLSDTLTGSIITKYEGILQTFITLAASIPMLMDTGGNAGSQSSTIIIRSLALGEIKEKDYFIVLYKELCISVLVGFGLAALNFCRMYFLVKRPLEIALLVSLTLMVTVVLAKVIGGILPLIIKRLKLDPAIMVSPLITTIVDGLSLIVYFYLAILILKI